MNFIATYNRKEEYIYIYNIYIYIWYAKRTHPHSKVYNIYAGNKTSPRISNVYGICLGLCFFLFKVPMNVAHLPGEISGGFGGDVENI